MSRRERQRRRQHNRGHPVGRVLLMTGILTICAVAIGALLAVGWVVATADSAPNLTTLHPRHVNPPTEIYAGDGSLLGYVHDDTISTYATPSQIPQRLKEATIAIEDRRFYQHGALDYQGILRAGVKDLLGQSNNLQGASTLTQQLVNTVYLPQSFHQHRDLKYKIIQAKLAEQLESKHSKNWILQEYLNNVSYGTTNGEEAVGVGAAALMFFNKPVWKINLAQMSLLAGLPQSPTQYNPTVHPKLAKARRNAVLRSMVESDYIKPGLAAAVEKQPLQLHPNARFIDHSQPYIFDYIQRQLDQKFGANRVEHGGLKVYTTIDLKMQQQALKAIYANRGVNAAPAAGLATVDPSNGHILAIASSATYDHTKFDYAVQAERQTGSAFKVFALMTLIHDYDGSPNDTFYTSKFLPVGWNPLDPTWSVHTAEETYQGTISITKATTVSDNTVFAQLAEDEGYDKLDATAHAMGVTSKLDAFPSEVIGGLRYCCTMLEMADAYATLANGGVHVPATILNKVVFPNGKVVNVGGQQGNRVFTDGEAYEGTQVLKTVIQDGTGTNANYGCPAAGKTGTAENEDNAWFVGYTPKLATAVWVGYPQGNIPMGAYGFGGTAAAPIWRDFMRAASGGYCGDFPTPTTYFTGTAFTGPNSSARSPSPSTTPGQTGTGAYTNPKLYAQPPKQKTTPGPTTTVQSGGGGVAPPGSDGGNNGGGGHGHHGGHG
jgi:penicillin-binding protein 1A